MKKLILIGIAIISICIISCQKDSPDKKNSVTIRGQEYELSAGGLVWTPINRTFLQTVKHT